MQTKAERTKILIIEKTAPLFNAKGYAGTSLNDMVNATGLTKGSIYGNFLNKDELALSAFDYNFQSVFQHIKKEMGTRDSIIGKLLVYPETYRQFDKLSFLNYGCPIINTATDSDDTHPLLREKAANAVQTWRASVERLLNTGIERGEIKPDTNVSAFAAILMTLIQGGIIQAKVTGDATSLYHSLDYLEQKIKDLNVGA